jgi:acyl-CoA:acyl-CoA alkyltransferase
MIISSIAAGFPSLRVTNEDLLLRVMETNTELPREEVLEYCEQVRGRLRQAGSETRFYRDRSKNETAYPILREAIGRALREADLNAKDIDLLIYCGVGRGFLEPAMAYFVASDFGLTCECFDIVDACMSWVRALYVAYNFFRTGRYTRALIVNAEFNIYERGYPSLTKIDSPSKWKHTYPAFTIGEAATATVLTASEVEWNFHFRSLPQNVNLCTLPLVGHSDYSPNPEWDLARNGSDNFMCFGDILSRRGMREMLKFIAQVYENPSNFAKWFPHLSTSELYRHAEKGLGLSNAIYTKTFASYGNLVSASIPVALQAALSEGSLERGDHIVLCPISAGMSMALVDFTY